MKPGYFSETTCRPVTDILNRIGDKWSVMIVMVLRSGTRRFSELKLEMNGVSQKMLTTALRGLERDGFVRRTVYPTIPPKVEYELTDLGHELSVPVRALGEWAIKNRERVLKARDAFDAGVPGVQAAATARPPVRTATGAKA
jgi:DNA-binding HxlR family transcriptional regulator